MAIPYRQQDEVRHRIERFFLIIALCYVALVARLVYLQAIEGGYFRERATKMRDRKMTLHAQRGAILDRDGKPLAVTTHKGDLVCDPRQVKDPARTAEILAGILGVPKEQILPLVSPHLLKNGRPAGNVMVQTGIEPAMVDAIQQARSDRELRKDLAGINVIDRPDRTYPGGREMAQVVGLLMPGKDGQMTGAMGVERSLNTFLCGHDGYVVTEVDPRRRPIPDTQSARQDAADGADVRLTIDSTVQHIVDEELGKCFAAFHPDGAAAIVLDPKTGDVLAMASYPQFDPLHREQLGQPGEPGRNRALTPFEPGSTMKIVTAAAALRSGAITENTIFHCSGSYQLYNKNIRDAEHMAGGHGDEDIKKVIAESCNVCTAQIGVKVGLDRLRDAINDFGLLDKTGIELTADQRGSLGPDTGSQKGDVIKVARVAFGQSVMVSPLAMASVYATVANGGLRVPPRLVLSYQDANGKTVRSFPPKAPVRVLSPELAATLKGLLRAVVTDGTGKGKANVPGYTVAGKTGTAQKVVPGHRGYSGQHIASFIGFLPASNPRAVIYVMADNPKNGYYGAQVAAPVFQAIGERLMWYWKVPPDDPATLTQAAKR